MLHRAIRVTVARSACLLVIMASATGCGGRDAGKQAYDSAYKSSYAKTFEAGKASGHREGSEKGAAMAEAAIRSGHAWRPYTPFFAWSAFFGVVAGVFLQYLVLSISSIEKTGSMFWVTVLVAGSRRSLAYGLFKRRRRLELEYIERLEAIQVGRELESAGLEAAKVLAMQRLAAAASIEEVSQLRFVNLAEAKMSKLVSDAEERARVLNSSGRSSTPTSGVVTCPHCQKRFGYLPRAATKTVKCPHQQCRKPVALPPGD